MGGLSISPTRARSVVRRQQNQANSRSRGQRTRY